MDLSAISLSPELYIILLPFIFLAGFIDAIAGGGGLISLPAYLAAGIPSHFALGTNKFSSVFGTFFATLRYFKHGMIDVPVAVTAGIMALIGAGAGTKTVLLINPSYLNYILAFLIPVIAVFTILNKGFGRHNNSHTITHKKKIALGAAAGLVIGFYDGFFGPGTGTFLILVFAIALRYDFVTANGNTKVVNLASNIASVTAFLFYGKVVFLVAIPAAFFSIAGNLAGSRYVVKYGSKGIRPVFITALLLLLMKVMYNIFI